MSEPAQKCENNDAILKQNYAQKLFIAFKMTNSCCFGLRGNLDFPDFLQKNYKSCSSQMNGRTLIRQRTLFCSTPV